MEREFGQNLGERYWRGFRGYILKHIYRKDMMLFIVLTGCHRLCTSVPLSARQSLVLYRQIFGAALSFKFLWYLINPEKCLDEMIRVLKPNGLLIIMIGKVIGKEKMLEWKTWTKKFTINPIDVGLEIIKIQIPNCAKNCIKIDEMLV